MFPGAVQHTEKKSEKEGEHKQSRIAHKKLAGKGELQGIRSRLELRKIMKTVRKLHGKIEINIQRN